MAARLAGLSRRISDGLDRMALAVSPRWAHRRAAYRFAYEALDGTRTRKPRSLVGGTGDSHLTEQALSNLREICRDYGRNNPLVKGLLKVEANGVVGSSTKIEVRSSDKAFNKDAEDLWRERIVESPCDVTGRFAFHKLLRTLYESYRRDGDAFLLLTDDGVQFCEGDQCGTPYGVDSGTLFNVTNGVATRKSDSRVIGYYIGQPDKWGYIRNDQFQRYTAEQVVHVFNADRCSYTRGEPALTSAVDWIDKVTRYADAALVAAHVNALFVMAITKRFPEGMLPTARPSQASTETSDEGFKQEKLGPGLIYECGVGEDARAIAPAHPSADFDPFILRCLSFIGRPLCFPLTYVSGDFAGATYMNMRFALDLTRDNFIQEQEEVIVPLLHRWHRWQMERWIQSELKGAPEDWYKRLIRPKRWRYIDALKDAQADILLMEKRLKSRRHIMGDRGYDFDEETDEMMADERILKDKGLAPVATEPAGGSDDGDDKEDDEERQ